MCVDRRKRIWVAGNPEYGARHGGLGCYDTVRRKYVNRPVVIPDQSIWALRRRCTCDILYGGTINGRGSGMASVTKAAHLFAWDTRRQKLRWKQVAIPGVTEYLNLLWRDGKLYGTTGKPFSFFCFDPQTRAMDYVVPSEISGCREQSVCFGPDGNLYGITWMALFRWRPETGQIEVLYRCAGEEAKQQPGGSLFHRGAVNVGDRFYFSSGAKVMSLRLPGAGRNNESARHRSARPRHRRAPGRLLQLPALARRGDRARLRLRLPHRQPVDDRPTGRRRPVPGLSPAAAVQRTVGLAFTIKGTRVGHQTSGRLCRLDLPGRGNSGSPPIPATGFGALTAARTASSTSAPPLKPNYSGTMRDGKNRRSRPARSAGEISRPVVGGDDGYVYVAIGSGRSQVVAYHIATGQVTHLLPKSEVGPDWQLVSRGRDGQIDPDDPWPGLPPRPWPGVLGRGVDRKKSTREPGTLWEELTRPTLPGLAG